jgi:hypothetical protein
MKRKPLPKKIILRRDTIRQLGSLELARAEGAGAAVLAKETKDDASCPLPAALTVICAG